VSHNNKEYLFVFFVDFRQAFDIIPDIIPGRNILICIEDLGIPFEHRFGIYRYYEQVIAKLKTSQGWSEKINCNMGGKQGCPLSHTLFEIYI